VLLRRKGSWILATCQLSQRLKWLVRSRATLWCSVTTTCLSLRRIISPTFKRRKGRPSMRMTLRSKALLSNSQRDCRTLVITIIK
jgi:hypothetical protein